MFMHNFTCVLIDDHRDKDVSARDGFWCQSVPADDAVPGDDVT